MKGKHAPEAACGDILAKLKESYHIADVEVVAKCVHLDTGGQDEVMDDWHAGRRFVESLLTIKVAHWETLPWLLCGIGHYDLSKARTEWGGLAGVVDMWVVVCCACTSFLIF